MAPDDFEDLTVTKGPWTLVWEWLEEGDCGDYDPDDATDRPRLRATLHFEGEPVGDGSYCTLATPGTCREHLRAFALELLAPLRDRATFSRKAMQAWTWTTGR